MKCCDCLSLSIHKEDFWTCKLLLLVKKLTFLEQVLLGFLCSCPSIFDRKSQGIQFFSISGSILLHNFQNYNEEEAFGAKNRFLTRAIQSFTITFALGSLPHWRTIIVSSYCEFCHWTQRSRLNDAFCNSTGCSTPFVDIGELLEKSIEKWKYWVDDHVLIFQWQLDNRCINVQV